MDLAARDADLAYRAVDRDLDPGFQAGLGHRLGDGPHAADRVAPGPAHAIHLAEDMVDQHIGRARRVGAGVISDHGVETHQALQHIGLEPVVEQFARALAEQIEQVGLALQPHLAHLIGKAERGHEIPRLGRNVVWRLEQDAAQHLDDLVQPCVEGFQLVRVARREFGDLAMRAGLVLVEYQIGFIVDRAEIGQRPNDDPQPMPGQLHVRDDFGVEQADRIAGGRVTEARMEFLGDRRAADEAPPLQHAHLVTGLGQIESAGQPVMAASDDQHIICHRYYPPACARFLISPT